MARRPSSTLIPLVPGSEALRGLGGGHGRDLEVGAQNFSKSAVQVTYEGSTANAMRWFLPVEEEVSRFNHGVRWPSMEL